MNDTTKTDPPSESGSQDFSDQVDKMSKAFIDSSKRSRYIIIILVFASVITFIAYWNTRQANWSHCRLRKANFAYEYQLWKKDYRIDLYKAVSFYDKEPVLYDRFIKDLNIFIIDNLDGLRKSLGDCKTQVDSLKVSSEISEKDELSVLLIRLNTLKDGEKLSKRIDTLRNALNLCEYRQFNTEEALFGHVRDLDRMRTERILMIPVFIFGVTFDVNDLGLFGGFAFSVLLLWLMCATSIELKNLRMVFKKAGQKREFLEFSYKYLAMNQMLTVPKSISGMPEQKHRVFWNFIPNLLFVLPIIVQLLVILHDLATKNLGDMVNQINSLIGLLGGFLFFVIIAFLTYKCFKLVYETDKIWDSVAEELIRNE